MANTGNTKESLENTIRIIRNLKGLLTKGYFVGDTAPQVTSGYSYLEALDQSLSAQLETLNKEAEVLIPEVVDTIPEAK